MWLAAPRRALNDFGPYGERRYPKEIPTSRVGKGPLLIGQNAWFARAVSFWPQDPNVWTKEIANARKPDLPAAETETL